MMLMLFIFFFSSRRRHTRLTCDWSSDVCSSDLLGGKKRRLKERRRFRPARKRDRPWRPCRPAATIRRGERVFPAFQEHLVEIGRGEMASFAEYSPNRLFFMKTRSYPDK